AAAGAAAKLILRKRPLSGCEIPRRAALAQCASAPDREEPAQQLGRIVAEKPALDDDAVIQPLAAYDVEHRSAGAGLRIRRRIHGPRDPRVHERAGAHRARPERYVERRARQAIVADPLSGRAQREHLRVSARVVLADRRVTGL